jgi:hypothetical protein
VVVPFDYLRLPAVALMAWLVFAEVPVIWTWIGGAIIAASSNYMTLREMKLKRHGRPGATAQGAGPPGEAPAETVPGQARAGELPKPGGDGAA